jgi:Flp pilus assembly protein TadD
MAAAFVAVVSLVLYRQRRRWTGALAAWASYLILIAPNSGLFRMGQMFIAERYSYLATLGFYVAGAGGIVSLLKRSRSWRPRVAVAAGGMMLLAGLLPMTWSQCRVWRSSESMWSHASAYFARVVASDPGSAGAHHNLGIALFYRGRFEEAAREFRAALDLDPGNADAQATLGRCLERLGRLPEALTAIERAVRLDPQSADLRGGLAVLLVGQGRLDAALAAYREALELDPGSPEWHAGLGIVLYRQGRLAEAEAALSQAVRLDPDRPEYRDDLRRVRRARGSPGRD